jgi:hypothetical protein
MKYILICTYSVIALVQFLRVVKLFFPQIGLKNKIFDFPQRKSAILGYYLCALAILIFLIVDKLNT